MKVYASWDGKRPACHAASRRRRPNHEGLSSLSRTRNRDGYDPRSPSIVLCDKTLIGPEDLDLFPEALAPIQTLAQAREDFQRRYILEVLERNNGNRTKTARDLGVDPRTIFRYLEREPDAPEPTSGTAKTD